MKKFLIKLTEREGTSSQSLVRGLRMAVAGSDRNVEVASSEPAAWTSRGQLPNIAVIRFRQLDDAGPVTRLLGAGEEGHAVVVHSRFSDGRWLIAGEVSFPQI